MDFSRLLASDGYDVALVARSESKLRDLARELESKAGIKAAVIVADLAKPNAAQEIFDAAGPVDVLINNAGFGLTGAFVQTDLRAELEMIQVNVVALTHLTKLFVRPMATRGSGRILNVASTAAFQPGPFMAVYYATKAYVLSFSDAIADELRRTGVTVTTLCPGPTDSGFAGAAGMESTRLFKIFKPMSSAEVARYGYEAMKKGRGVVIPGLRNKLVAQSIRVTPRRIVNTIVRNLNQSR
jgi:short-subunit dehydrogenase